MQRMLRGFVDRIRRYGRICVPISFSSIKRISPLVLATLAAVGSATPVVAAVKLPSVLSDHAVLKRSAATRVWGTASPGEAVSVRWSDQSVSTTADATGDWSTTIDLSRSSAEPFELIVTGSNELRLKDVVAGEVWLASGQSNMDFQLSSATGGKEEIAKPRRPEIRFFKVGLAAEKEPARDVRGKWIVAAPDTVGGVSAVAYFFAQKLQRELGGSVGVVQSSWGGSNCEAWTSPDALNTVPALKAAKEKYWKLSDEVKVKRTAFTEQLKKWIADNKRQDRPMSDPKAFADPAMQTQGWVPVDIAGVVKGQGLANNGAIWLRREVQVPENLAGRGTTLRMTCNAMEQVYWNGQLVRARSIDDYFNPTLTYISIPAEWIKAGKAVLTIRLYAPLTSPAFLDAPPSILGQTIDKGWFGKTEYAFTAAAEIPGTPSFPPPAVLGSQRTPGFLYNAMIAPMTRMTLSGVVWYQGEDNASRAVQYKVAFPLMIEDWRTRFDQPDLPFLYCQLPAFGKKRSEIRDSSWAELREAQTETRKLAHTGQAVLIDTGEAGDIHPLNKGPAGDRLARLALSGVYKKAEIETAGPVYTGFEIRGNKVVAQFRHTGRLSAATLPERYDVSRVTEQTAKLELNSPGSEIEGFQICGQDKKWAWAQAHVDGDSVAVSAPGVPKPVAIRYGWADNPTCNLTDASGLPAWPFRTDDFVLSTVKGAL